MSLKLTTYRYGMPRRKGEGLRVGTTRYLPRGVAKKDYGRLNYFDVWLPLLAPSRELLNWFREEEPSTAEFHRRYRKEMAATDPRQTIALLAAIAKSTPISIGCYCEDESRCHRSALYDLIVAAR